MSCSRFGARKISRIFVSTSKCIFANLAFEEHLFRSRKHDHALLVWSNNPCIVVGRHQNPWLEVHVEEADRRRIDVVRRYSGGGAVYHDLDNLNISFLTPKDEHCRPKNLQFIVNAVEAGLNIQLETTKRDDLLLNGKKVSGTAARIARGMAYHHLTLLVAVNREAMHTLLHSPVESHIQTNATRSTRAASVGCLQDIRLNLNVNDLRTVLIEAYSRQFEICQSEIIDPDDLVKTKSEIAEIHDELQSWLWKFGKTPRFQMGGISVEKGFITSSSDPSQVGRPFHPQLINNL